jgi:hypothetical protein
MAVRLSALYTCYPLLPERFLVLISVRGRVNPRDICSDGDRNRSIEKSHDLIRNQSLNLLACRKQLCCCFVTYVLIIYIIYIYSITGVEKATEALEVINGYILRKKPMILQYGHTLSSKSKLKADLQS